MNKKVLNLFGALFVFLSSMLVLSVQAEEIDSKDPYRLIQSITDKTFSHLKANQKTYQTSPDLLKKVARKDILPYVNVRYAALKVLGPLARKTSKTERDEFTDAFSEYLVAAYAQILIQYTDQTVKVEESKAIDASRNLVSVRVDILDKKRPPINLDFKLRKNNKSGDWQGFDVHVEGVSMLDTKASEWQSDLRKYGIGHVTEELKELAKAPIKSKESTS